MHIDVKQYILDRIGSTSWAGESNHDKEALIGLYNIESILSELEDIREELFNLLKEHKEYRKGNYSAEQLHNAAGKILLKFINQDIVNDITEKDYMTEEEFKKYWEEGE